MEKRRDAILAEIEAIKSGAIKPAAEWGAEWAGDYHGGYGRYYIAPQSGCVYTHFSGCDGGLEFHHGDIIETTPEGVRIRFDPPLDPVRAQISEWVYFVRWGDHRMLLSQQSVIYLVNMFRQGEVVFLTSMPMIDGGPGGFANRAPLEPPVFPARFRPLLDVPPTDAKIVEMTRIERREWEPAYYRLSGLFTIDKGHLDSVRKDTYMDAPWGHGFLSVMSTKDHTASVMFYSMLEEHEKDAGPKVGDTLSILTVPAEFLAPEP